MNYRFLAWDEEHEEFVHHDTYLDAKKDRARFQNASAFVRPIEVNCSEHGWQFTTWGQCNQCKATQEMTEHCAKLEEET